MEPRNPITQGKLNLCFYEIDAKKRSMHTKVYNRYRYRARGNQTTVMS